MSQLEEHAWRNDSSEPTQKTSSCVAQFHQTLNTWSLAQKTVSQEFGTLRWKRWFQINLTSVACSISSQTVNGILDTICLPLVDLANNSLCSSMYTSDMMMNSQELCYLAPVSSWVPSVLIFGSITEKKKKIELHSKKSLWCRVVKVAMEGNLCAIDREEVQILVDEVAVRC